MRLFKLISGLVLSGSIFLITSTSLADPSFQVENYTKFPIKVDIQDQDGRSSEVEILPNNVNKITFSYSFNANISGVGGPYKDRTLATLKFHIVNPRPPRSGYFFVVPRHAPPYIDVRDCGEQRLYGSSICYVKLSDERPKQKEK